MPKDKILVINCHPNPESFNWELAKAYKRGALKSGARVEEIVVARLNFNPNLEFGYQKRSELPPDLLEAWEKIKWADHMVWVHPVWWGGLPAIAKGFIDRLFLPGFAFKYRDNSIWWDKLLAGKSAHIITTLDQPGWYYRLMSGRPSINQLKFSVLKFCGVAPVSYQYIQPIRNSDIAFREKWLTRIEKAGAQRR